MKKWFLKNGWWLIIVFLPVIFMLFLHLCVAINQYSGFNISIAGVTAEDWFLYMAGYLGGCIALIGVRLSIKHNTNSQRYQMSIQRLEKEQEDIVVAISQLNVQEPANIIKLFSSLVEHDEINVYNTANLNDRINTQIFQVNSSRMRMLTATNATYVMPACATCKEPCRLKQIIPDLAKEYDSATENLHKALNEVSRYITIRTRNMRIAKELDEIQRQHQGFEIPQDVMRKTQQLNEEFTSLEKQADICIELCEKCASMNTNEMTNLIGLTKGYILQRQENIRKICFEDWKGGAS